MNNSPEAILRRVLVIDDNPAIHDDFRKTLIEARDTGFDEAEEALFGSTKSSGPPVRFDLNTASQGQEGLEMLLSARKADNPYQLAFVDMRMPPGWDGVQTIAKLWEVDPDLQVVICTAYSDYSWNQIVETLGVTDRLLILKKPFDPAEVCQLATTLTEKWLMTRQARLKLAQLEALVHERTTDLRSAALHDKLTGLPNRALCLERLSHMMSIKRRDRSRHFAVLFLDFDGFKLVNDSLGHDTGDLLLQSIATRLTACLRETDAVVRTSEHTAARLGGDEFIVLLDGLAAPQDAVVVAERLLKEVSLAYDLKGHVIHCSASIGITTSQQPYQTADEVIRDADTAMYHAKASGKGQYVCFDPAMHEAAVKRVSLQRDLQQAVEKNQLELAYQPIISLASGRPISFEVLVRWNHPTRGSVPPLEFIQIAEETNLIHPLGEWVLREATHRWSAAVRECPNLSDVSLSINISRRQLASPGLPALISSVLAESGLRAERLRLEITESSIIGDVSVAVRTLERIRALGVALDIDDFGTGYSSLSCLHKFPISGLKIDRSFIHAIGERHDYAAVVQAIIALARNLGIDLIAEGIETADQATLLHSMGVDHAQGYLFARPLPLHQAIAAMPVPPLLAAA